MIMLLTNTAPADGIYTGAINEGVPVLPWIGNKLSFILNPLFGFTFSESIAVPITALGSAGAALGVVKGLVANNLATANDLAVFTSICMCYSGYLSTHVAMMDAIGASSSIEVSRGILTDIGGGSSEIVIIDQNKVIKSTSLSIGSLSAFNDYVDQLFMTTAEKKSIDSDMKKMLEEKKFYREKHDLLCAVGGSARASLKFYNEYYKLDSYNTTMQKDKFNSMLKEVIEEEPREILDSILEVKPDRIHTLLPGMAILNRVAKYFYCSEISVSQTGVREGYVYSKLLGRNE